jgi:predicted hydrocarbon binding protein
VNVKAQGLLHGIAFVRERFGEQEAERVLAACSPAVRDRCATAIAINWIPLAELVEFLTVADRVLGAGDGKIAEAIGAASARINLRHLALRLAFFLGRPEFLMRRVAGVWRQYNERGEMVVREFLSGRMLAELTGFPEPDWYLCCSITGWLHEAGLATGMKDLSTEHVECRARGKARCAWVLRWDGGRSLAHADTGNV